MRQFAPRGRPLTRPAISVTAQNAAQRLALRHTPSVMSDGSEALHEVLWLFDDCHLNETERLRFRIRTAHMPTTEMATRAQYFIVRGRDFALDDPGTTRFVHDQLLMAFQEDLDGLALQERALANTPAENLYEFSVAVDAPAVAMRRYVLARQQKEAKA
jgi:vanillate O-demethylase monooxygenase subunit